MPNFDLLLQRLNEKYPDREGKDNNDRGKEFELITKWFLENDNFYSQQFKKIWTCKHI